MLLLLDMKKNPSKLIAEKNKDREMRPLEISLAELTVSTIFVFRGIKLLYANPALEKLTGYSQQELKTMNYLDLFCENEKKDLRRQEKQLERGEISFFRKEFQIITKKGEERWIDLTLAPIEYDDQNAIAGT